MRPAKGQSGSASSDYRAKVSDETVRLARHLRNSGQPEPLGDPASGVVLVVETPIGPRVLDALGRSLDAVGLPEAYVTWAAPGAGDLLLEQLLSTEPDALVALGPGAAREIDALRHPLALRAFSEAPPGAWFAWTRGTRGLSLPPLAPALDDEAAKRRFWRAFLSLKALSSGL